MGWGVCSPSSTTRERVIFDVKFDGGLLVAIVPTLNLLCAPKYRVLMRQGIECRSHKV